MRNTTHGIIPTSLSAIEIASQGRNNTSRSSVMNKINIRIFIANINIVASDTVRLHANSISKILNLTRINRICYCTSARRDIKKICDGNIHIQAVLLFDSKSAKWQGH